MNRTLLAGLIACVAAAVAAPVAAVNCYAIIDRNDNVVYRGTLPPIDLSAKGQPERDALRKRGEQLIAMDVDRCFGIEYPTGAAGSTTLTVDAIVAGIQPLRRSGGAQASTAGGGVTAPMPPAGPAAPSSPAPAAPRSGTSSSGTRSSY